MLPFMTSHQSPRTQKTPSSNLRDYIARATGLKLRFSAGAPPLPPKGHKSHLNSLKVRPERYRILAHQHRIQGEELIPRVLEYLDEHIPSTPLNKDGGTDENDGPLLPCEGYNVSCLNLQALLNFNELQGSWIDCHMLQSIQHLLQMVPGFDGLENWRFTFNDNENIDHKLFRYYLWGKVLNLQEEPANTQRSTLLIACQPPWILSERDLEQVLHTRQMPMYDPEKGDLQDMYNSAQRVWAKLWDVCKENDCHYFMLTNYSQWVLGGFSEGWRNGFVTSIKQVDTPNPNRIRLSSSEKRSVPSILEHLIYWIISSMGLPGGYTFPMVPESDFGVTSLNNDSAMVQGSGPVGSVSCAPSASIWTGTTDNTSPITIDLTMDDDGMSDDTERPQLDQNWRVVRKDIVPEKRSIRLPNLDNRLVQQWKKDVKPVDRSTILSENVDRGQSPALSEWSDASETARTESHGFGYMSLDGIVNTMVKT